MRTMACVFPCLMAAMLMSFVGSSLHADAKADELAKLNGAWVAVAVDTGDPAGADELKNRPLKLVFEGDVITAFEGAAATQPATKPSRKGDQVTISSIDGSAKPAAMDFGPTPKEQIKAIYRVDGDTLEICFAKDAENGKRPAEFKGDKKVGTVSFKLKRVK